MKSIATRAVELALADGATVRARWARWAEKLAGPVLTAGAASRLKEALPLEVSPECNDPADRARFTHLEAVGRLLAGLAPWLELATQAEAVATLPAAERAGLARWRELAVATIVESSHPLRPGYLNWRQGAQPVVDAAFLAHALVRAPRALVEPITGGARGDLAASLAATRDCHLYYNNWLLFGAMVEAGLSRLGAWADRVRVESALNAHLQWYKGDGVYGDGPDFHWDFYNSFVIHPMLVDVVGAFGPTSDRLHHLPATNAVRLRRYAAVLERMVAPDGTFPPLGRSLCYRAGAFQALAQAALQNLLPPEVPPGQARAALTAVLYRTLEAPGTWTEGGWLQLGLAGYQPHLAEGYISTGSLYLVATALLPLGLPPRDPFWSEPAAPWTSKRLWQGEDLPRDAALYG